MNNPFALFDLPVDFIVDQDLLAKRYLTLQKTLHPDNFANGSAQEQRLAMQKSSEINDALQILKNPILRADSIIALNLGVQEDLEQTTNHNIDFLMQQMTWREQLEVIEQQKNVQQLQDFYQKIEEQDKIVISALSEALSLKDWQKAKEFNDKLRFIKKLLLEIERVEEQLIDF
ncbi:co-chaperone protein HscB [Bisgaardia hudsonensis]|uniref:Co-chaperone protein HscB homolog n=1 Tax=Bisgaardia hudsonensis TaxID=109472 RepID=A0A4R2N0L1_9PAST|nr:Fe-S protein assembly co-chaperone HscB [Bisgaardia hudsonensis]QLB13504.1 Fe-S protein assembly co-chaperone HscB [Bisgaardia hudsonensis]TCP12915.1 co-chaperone protein HscB [Bisgaardia hudsonensis]